MKDFFDSFHFGRVRGFFCKNKDYKLPIEVATVLSQLVCYKGKLPQGAPTSPIITNLICDILDKRLSHLARKYRLNYTRYADDLTFSTNDKYILLQEGVFRSQLFNEIERFGCQVNTDKIRIVYRDSRQIVTGLIVNKKINVCREYYKKTRAMADRLYQTGKIFINDTEGSVAQLEGRLAFIDQLEQRNNERKSFITIKNLSAKERQYQIFLFYKYFFANGKPLIITEGKTDVRYIKAALKKYFEEFPELISRKEKSFSWHLSFLRRTDRLSKFFGISVDGADTLQTVYDYYAGRNVLNIYEYLYKKANKRPYYPVILIFDNEQQKGKPLKKFLNYINLNRKLDVCLYQRVIGNLYVLTHKLPEGKEVAEIEDLFTKETLNIRIAGKYFSRKENVKNTFGKEIFSKYVMQNYQHIDFSGFKTILEDIKKIIVEYNEK